VHFSLCPSLEEQFGRKYPDQHRYDEKFQFPMRVITDPGFPWLAEVEGFVPKRHWNYDLYYDPPIAAGARMDIWGTAHEPGGKAAHHMTHMRHPLERLDSLEQFQAYPWPDFEAADWSFLDPEIAAIHEQGLAAQVWMECTIWETAWYMRRMDLLMTEMALEDEAAKSVKPDLMIQYHSCGFVTPLISDLIEAGVDVLNPVQPESMDFEQVYAEFGDRISFNGTIGTQTTMPFATPEQVREMVFRNLEIAGGRGGLLCCPTHMLQPEVPWENVEAYVQACKDFKSSRG